LTLRENGLTDASVKRTLSLAALLAAFLLALPAHAATFSASPGNINPRKASSVKTAVKKILATGKVPAGWNGNVATGNAGTTSQAYQKATLTSVNIFRKLAGLNPVVFDTDLGAKCAEAALMMSANRQLNHFPPASWQFYTANGAEAAGKSNLFLGFSGPFTIPGYIDDTGTGNEAVGHRRWILWSQSQVMGTGDVLGGGGYSAANALWVLPTGASPAPVVKGGFVAWPYAGSVPNTLVFQRWSFGVPFANFSAAKVSVKRGNKNIPVRIVDRSSTGVGDNTIVFQPKLTYTGTGSSSTVLYQAHLKAPLKQDTYTVTVSNVALSTGGTKTFKYRVKVFPMK
jgi:hypothetical protein